MAKTQIKTNWRRKFFGWFGRHKVTATFSIFVLAGALYLVGSWAVLQVQIHFERERFIAAESLVADLNDIVSKGSSTDRLYKNCSYTSDGAVFAIRSLGCAVDADINFQGASKVDAILLSTKLQAEAKRKTIHPYENKEGMDTYDISNYVFKYENIVCGFSTTYYPSAIAGADRFSGAVPSGTDLYVSIDCSGPARAEYFSVTTD